MFPGAEFVARPKRENFTSPCRLPPTPPARPPLPTAAEKLAGYLVGELYPGRRQDKVDFAIVVDDLELFNVHQPDVVVRHFVAGVEEHVRRNFKQLNEQNLVKDLLREKGSFHLFAPMVEAYFFGEMDALRRADVPTSRVRRTTSDLEDFATDDPEYLAASTNVAFDAKHPKRYIDYLTDDGYAETRGGVQALECLDWKGCTGAAAETRFAHSMFEDLARMLNTPNPCLGDCHPTTLAKKPVVLRNV
jgi:hypothetical protein